MRRPHRVSFADGECEVAPRVGRPRRLALDELRVHAPSPLRGLPLALLRPLAFTGGAGRGA